MMKNFNAKLAPYLDDDTLKKIINLSNKPVSLRYIAKEFNLTVYGVKRLLEYYDSINQKQGVPMLNAKEIQFISKQHKD